MAKVEIYTKGFCPYCTRAKHLLASKGISFTEYDVSGDDAGLRDMIERSQRHTVPQIFINDHHIGGSDDLILADRSGQLDQLLAPEATT